MIIIRSEVTPESAAFLPDRVWRMTWGPDAILAGLDHRETSEMGGDQTQPIFIGVG